jgi:hypothetical protein
MSDKKKDQEKVDCSNLPFDSSSEYTAELIIYGSTWKDDQHNCSTQISTQGPKSDLYEFAAGTTHPQQGLQLVDLQAGQGPSTCHQCHIYRVNPVMLTFFCNKHYYYWNSVIFITGFQLGVSRYVTFISYQGYSHL